MEDAKLTLYWNIVSQPSRAVKALLSFGNVPHKEVTIDISKGEQYGEEYVKINPSSVVPFIIDGDFKLGESNAILKYLADTYSTIPEHLFPKDPKKRAIVD